MILYMDITSSFDEKKRQILLFSALFLGYA